MKKLTKDTNIAVLIGGPGSERQVSLVSGQAVADALIEAGYRHVTTVDVTSPKFDLPTGTELAYIIIHGTFGEDGELQARLEKLDVPFTGARAASSAKAFDKAVTKQILVQAGIRTPLSETIKTSEKLRRPALPLPFVVKPACEGSSVGVTIVRDEETIMPALKEAARYGETILVEEYIEGRELTVGVLDGKAMPIVHIVPRSGFYDINNKYPWMNKGGGTDYYCPADLPQHIAAEIAQLTERAVAAVGVEVYGRVDFILRERDMKPYLIEINTIPGMTPSSLLPKSAAAAGWSYTALCEQIAQLSLNA